ncbi:hypothetical protein DXB65_00460 [Bacteroides oleiciplenus]|uniref:Uncharacterized protein n=1 Tax=Bacteroides oleiciplenus TaxID=626931 RepID=A0A3E5BRB3_9BACE|nr:hypothetical protein DXB65_00460 [Bacteroides oleiciplenus]
MLHSYRWLTKKTKVRLHQSVTLLSIIILYQFKDQFVVAYSAIAPLVTLVVLKYNIWPKIGNKMISMLELTECHIIPCKHFIAL